MLGARLTLVAACLVLMAGATLLLGFIPLLQGLLPPAVTGGGGGGAVAAWALHVLNGVSVMGLLGVALAVALAGLHAAGLVSLWWLPDPWCPLLCVECNGGGGLGWAPMECVGAGECGLVLLVVVVVVGFVGASYLLYHLLGMCTQRLLERAQHMVENVQPHNNAPDKGVSSCEAV